MATPAAPVRRARGDGATPNPSPPANLLLARLPDSELSAVLERAEQVTFRVRDPLFEKEDRIESVFFPLTGMISLLTVLRDGTALESMTVGREGFVGLPILNGIPTHRTRGVCQIEGDFYKVPADGFMRLVEDAPQLGKWLQRYAQFAHELVAQAAACNSSHLIEQRCARWLLTTADAVGGREFGLTQEFLSQMLAVRRAGVTVAIGGLERQSLISHRYGKIRIVDVEGLKAASCECYGTLQEKARELLA